MTFVLNDSGDGVNYTGARTANTFSFRVMGGKYSFYVSAASTSSQLNILLPDNSTYVAFSSSTTQTTSAAGPLVLDLPACTLQMIFTATGDVQGFIQKIPYNPAY